MTVITVASVDDAEEIGTFQTLCWELAYRGVVPDAYLDATTPEVREARWRDRIRSGERCVFTARSGAHLLGVASTAPTALDRPDLPALELCSIYVAAHAHGTRVADELITTAIGESDTHLLVFTVNYRAQHFYTKHGFEPTGEVLIDSDTGLEEQRWARTQSP